MSFRLLWCERCGHADEVRRAPDLPPFATTAGPLICETCNEPLTLLEANVRGSMDPQTHRAVAYLYDLPRG